VFVVLKHQDHEQHSPPILRLLLRHSALLRDSPRGAWLQSSVSGRRGEEAWVCEYVYTKTE